MNLSGLSKPLTIEQIDFRIQSVNLGGYATILAYKDARVDMQRLDEVCSPLNWKREHTRDNKNCIISVWDDEKKHWVSKEDTGAESNTEKEKGLASDSFKRAGFNWGIGRELYDYPVIQVKLNGDEFEKKTIQNKERAFATWKLKLREWKWDSRFDSGVLVFLQAKDQDNKVRFTWGAEARSEPTKTFEEYENIIESAFLEGTAAKEWWEPLEVQIKKDYPKRSKELIQLKNVLVQVDLKKAKENDKR